MDSAGITHRVLENKELLLELHSVDGAPFDSTYLHYIFKTIQLGRLQSLSVAAESTTFRSSFRGAPFCFWLFGFCLVEES
jgi:hypothetical protein